ncbi:tetratricopeptide repeat protein [Commensalibacter papalotli (ex Botero et al. 2024)]|nr:tetratricopeptide repeat protein [Commensalibacter papalotli (ex Botero et al. 2024)]CAI3941429.1 unnamed protein product [Commensalibacter papalotli (ex Botero et al. 2024)]
MHILKYFLLITTCTAYFFPQTFAVEVTKVNITKLEHRANQDSAEDQYNLGQLYEKTNNQGITQDYFKAIEWYTKAANQGLAKAQYSLGKLYEKSQGVPQDYAKAVELYTKAANQGLVDAQYSLGQLYEKKHQNMPQDYTKAIEWYTKAANQKIILNKNNIASYAIPRNSYYRIVNLISSADFKKSQNIPIIKEFF